MQMTTDQNKDAGKLLKVVSAIAIRPEDAQAIVERYQRQLAAKYPRMTDDERSALMADRIIDRYARIAAVGGAATALPGTIPGLGTAIAATGGVVADTAACMKIQVDLTMCIAAAYGYDITTEDARHMTFLIAAGAATEKAGADATSRIASKAGVKLLKQHLRGASLQAVKSAFRKVGVTFTRKAVERAIPFGVGVVVGGSFNYALTRYVGAQAKNFFVIDATTR